MAPCFTVAEEPGPMKCAQGLKRIPDYSFADAPEIRYLLVPGGFSAMKEMENPAMLAFLRERAATAEHVLSVCTGSLILHAAGLLENGGATTHCNAIDRLKALGKVEIEETRYVRHGNVWTSAGVSAGNDMTLAFIAAVAGKEAASIVQHNAEYYPDATVYGRQAEKTENPANIRALAAGG